MNTPKEPGSSLSFSSFYTQVFLPEHQHPLTVALHVAGTLLGLAWLIAMPLLGWQWLVLLFPVVHALPGLVAHRMVERNAAVGDVRITRKDYSPLWFIAANHRITWELFISGKIRR